MTPSLEEWPTKAKEAPSPHEVRLAPLDTNPVFQSLEGKSAQQKRHQKYAWFYSKFNAQSDELSPSFPKLQKVAQHLTKKQTVAEKRTLSVV